MLESHAEQLDLDRFERLVAGGRRRRAAASAAEALREALALWRGPALADFAYEPFAQAEIGAARGAAAASRSRSGSTPTSRSGGTPRWSRELEALVAEHPLRERLRGQLMLALYRVGPPGRGARGLPGARRALVDELGIEPSAALQELERAILRQDPALELAQATARSARSWSRGSATGRSSRCSRSRSRLPGRSRAR